MLHRVATFRIAVQDGTIRQSVTHGCYQPVLQRQDREGVIINCINVYNDTPKTILVNPRVKRE